MRWPKLPLRTNRIYILPTGHGLVFLGSLIVMVLTAATYNNNLIYILAFILFGVVLISMVQTHLNLKGVVLGQCQIPDTPQGDEISLQLIIRNSMAATRETLLASVGRPRRFASLPLLPAMSTERLSLKLPSQNRGLHHLERVEVSTNYPLGLFRAWTILDVNRDYYVYPRPQGSRDPQESAVEFQGAHSSQRQVGQRHGADFQEHRNFQAGDSFQHVDWKAFARNRPLLVKQFEGDSQKAYRFQMPQEAGPRLEQDLSQIALWILTAENEGAFYELIDGQKTLSMNAGFNHCQSCLRQLALYKDPHATQLA